MSQNRLSIAIAAAKNPFVAFKLAWRGLFPLGIVPKDPEAFRIGGWSAGKLPRQKITEVFPGIVSESVHVERVFDRDILTSIDPMEITTLCAVARHIRAKRILEIGTFNGNTALNFALNLPEAEIVTVDLPPNWDNNLAINVPDLYANVTDRSAIGVQFRDHPSAGRIRQVFGDSGTLDFASLGGKFDFIFIDGNHHYDYVVSDTKKAIEVLAPGGVIAWHDYGMMDDVSDAVDAEKQLKKHAIGGTRLVFGVAPG
jgi:predicted O-methyltransferase YrrM